MHFGSGGKYQNQDDINNVIGYVSRSPSKTNHKYLTHKLKFLSLKWAVIDQFHEYFYGNTSMVYTDNNLLTYAFTSLKLDAIGHCWIASLANYKLPSIINLERQL